MSESPEAKRQRLALADEHRSTAAAAAAPTPPHVPSSDSSVVVAITDNDSPSVEKIEQALCCIGIGDAEKSNKDEILGALEKLNTWAHSEDREDFFNTFVALDGIYRLLTFLNHPNNMDDKEYVVLVCDIMCPCDEQDRLIISDDGARKMAKQLVELNGIQTILLANKKYTDGNDIDKLRAVKSIWGLLWDVVEFASDVLDKEQALAVVDAALDTIHLLKDANNDAHSIWRRIFGTLEYVMDSGKVDESEVLEKDIIQKCLQALKTAEGNWNYDRDSWNAAYNLFSVCEKKHKGILSNNAHFGLFVSFCIELINRDPGDSSKVFKLLGKATEAAGKSVTINTTGIVAEMGKLLPSANDDVPQDVKDNANKLLKKLYN